MEYSDSLRAERFWIRTSVGTRDSYFSTTVQTDPRAHLASRKVGTEEAWRLKPNSIERWGSNRLERYLHSPYVP